MPPDARTLLVISGGREAVPVVLEAKRMGLRVLVSDGAHDAPGFRYAVAGLLASTYDREATVEAAGAYASANRIDGVIAAAADVPMTVAAVAHALGLPGIAVETAELASDKLAMKDAFVRAGVPVPWYARVESVAQLERLQRAADGLLVVKPVDSRGARGVVRLLPGIDAAWAFAVAEAESPTGRVMVERFVEGPQVSTESVVVGGRTTTIGFSDRNYELLDRFAPYVIENGGELPTVLPPATVEAVHGLVARAAAALGVTHGTVKGDVVVGPDGPMVIEMAVRLSGGYLCTHEIPLATGVNFVEAAIRLALGEKPDPAALVPRWSKGVVQRFVFPPPGTVVAIQGQDEAARGDGVALLEVRVRPGDRIRPMTRHVRRAGLVIAVGDTRDEALRRATAAAARVRIVTAPVLAASTATLH